MSIDFVDHKGSKLSMVCHYSNVHILDGFVIMDLGHVVLAEFSDLVSFQGNLSQKRQRFTGFK